MEKDGGEKSVELVRPFWMQKRYHSADVVQTLHLGAQGCFLVKITVDEITVLLCGDSAHPVNPDTTRMADHLAHHMLRHLILVTADRKVDVASLTPVFTVENFSIFSFFYIPFNPHESRFFYFHKFISANGSVFRIRIFCLYSEEFLDECTRTKIELT